MKKPKQVQVAVLSLPRNGTLALHQALQILGYTSYHFTTALDEHKSDLDIIRAGHQARVEVGAPFDFDSLLKGEYDAVVEIPAIIDPATFIHAHPNALIILTTRPPASWIKSYNATIGAVTPSPYSPHTILYSPFSPFLSTLGALQRALAREWAGGFDPRSAEGATHMEAFYAVHVALVRSLVPPERLLELEIDKLGWEPVCKFLGKEVPDVAWPGRHRPEEFGRGAEHIMRLAEKRALGRMGVVGVAVAVVVGVAYFVT